MNYILRPDPRTLIATGTAEVSDEGCGALLTLCSQGNCGRSSLYHRVGSHRIGDTSGLSIARPPRDLLGK